ncbi:hypothetical protein H0H93_013271 [Arthromyces matolae]|nr:hypothetical protein H0H93_013271 [Arthromyces matolae]
MFDETGLSWYNIQVPCRLLDQWPPEYHSLRPSPLLYELPSLSIHRRPTDTPEGYCIRIEVGLPQENAIAIDDLPSHHGWSSDPNIASWPVIAELEPDRPDSDRYTTKDLRNMRFISAAFNLCPGHEYLNRSRKLTVKLPITIDIPPILIEGTLWLPSVQDLVWRSHRNQLFLMFDPNSPHWGLTSLDLHCESISPEEFHRLLQVLAPTISYLKLFQLVPHVPKVWFHPSPTSTILEMQQLQTFLLETYICPGSIMSNFSFPMLQEYKLNPSGRLQPESVPGGYGEMNWETLTHNLRGYPNCLEEPTLSET